MFDGIGSLKMGAEVGPPRASFGIPSRDGVDERLVVAGPRTPGHSQRLSMRGTFEGLRTHIRDPDCVRSSIPTCKVEPCYFLIEAASSAAVTCR